LRELCVVDEYEWVSLPQKKWFLDVRNTPCARAALLQGIAGGLGIGLLYFLRTSVWSEL